MSDSSFSSVRCGACGLNLEDTTPPQGRVSCPNCGSTLRAYLEEVKDGIKVLNGHKAVGVRGGMSRSKGWFIKSESVHVPQQSRNGALAKVERVFDRGNDRYIEQVTMLDSGEVIHSTDEPLSAHKGHGSDKQNSLRNKVS